MKVFTYLGQYVVRSYHMKMKRIVLLCLISAAFIYNILPQPEGTTEIDQIRTKMAAARQRPDEPAPAVHRVTAALVEDTTEIDNEPAISEVAATSESESSGDEISHLDEVPFEDIKQGWRSDLKDYLIEIDPDNGEEIYNAYMEEAESYESEIDALAKEQEKAGRESRQDFDTLIGQLEVKHEEKLKEILGNHYSEVTDRHQQYNNSIQYMNRSDADIVGVSL